MPDMRTVIILNAFIFVIMLFIIVQLWMENRHRYEGLFLLVIEFLFLAAAFILIALRGGIPDWASVIAANVFAATGILCGYAGLARFCGVTARQVHNYVLLSVFPAVLAFFLYVRPSLAIRSLVISMVHLVLFAQCGRLLLAGSGRSLRPITRRVGLVFIGFMLVSVARIAGFFFERNTSNDFFHSGAIETAVFVAFLLLLIMFAFSITMMVNRRLMSDVTAEEEKFSKAFHSSPDAILLTRLADGTILDMNEAFTTMTGYGRDEAIGKRTVDLHLWESMSDRASVLVSLSRGECVRGVDRNFRRKNGNLLVGLYSAELLNIRGEVVLLSSIGDITERKEAERELHKALEENRRLYGELQHRVKNSFAMLSSMTRLTSASTASGESKTVLDTLAARIGSVAELYSLLHSTRSVTEVRLDKYCRQIVSTFSGLSELTHREDLEAIVVPVRTAAPIGLILTELVTNSLKHAFCGMTGGVLSIMVKAGPSEATLEVRDNGGGIRAGEIPASGRGMGLNLVHALAEQIGGSFRIESGSGGTACILTFPLERT